MTRLPFTLFLIDTSALVRAVSSDKVADLIQQFIIDGTAATCVTVDLEIGFTARNAAELQSVRKVREQLYYDLEIDDRVARRARAVQGFLAAHGLHRVAGSMDLLTAAAAELSGAVLVHYDTDFEHIASVTGQRHQWIAPRGSID
jgi:predicted nucleic acid-binding protein